MILVHILDIAEPTNTLFIGPVGKPATMVPFRNPL
jgi:hypothetical protein